ncbi:SPOR domain-containing protein [Oceanospirillum beijerinckii]|uniref:SPOR domain-containing protein n=1 Tax=Oceanospirillum beijerinckii TaxID=64976 RepID=UPI0004194215|nr:SPOR domain-containing protein [Oceanospirillum beijerinckii]
MKYGLKQRIIGAILVVSIAVIFLPILLDGGQRPPLSQTTTPIPDAPDKPSIKVAAPDPDDVDTDRQAKATEEDHGKSALTERNTLAAWTLQAASFKTEDNALRLRDRFRKVDIRSYVRKNKAYYVVYAGPFADTEKAAKTKQRLKTEFSVSAIMVRYDPMADVRN